MYLIVRELVEVLGEGVGHSDVVHQHTHVLAGDGSSNLGLVTTANLRRRRKVQADNNQVTKEIPDTPVEKLQRIRQLRWTRRCTPQIRQQKACDGREWWSSFYLLLLVRSGLVRSGPVGSGHRSEILQNKIKKQHKPTEVLNKPSGCL